MGLNHPTDVQWKRRCVTDDMLSLDVCDGDAPPKWQSSLALYSYTPDEEFQDFPGREVVYLKLTSTLTGYQPKDEEIEGEIDWEDLDVDVADDFQTKLEEYYRCTGALIQVTVGAGDEENGEGEKTDGKNGEDGETDEENGEDGADDGENAGGTTVEKPYIMDYQPKKRRLYDMVSETDQQVTRSLETVNVRKDAGTTESIEVLDVDMGSSTSFQAEASVGDKGGGGLGFSRDDRKKEGTKRMGQEQEARLRTSERGRERRETYSHTTQLSQVHHLFDSYHLGTNRALFFVLPRPYTKAPQSGFVRGPRGIDGVQEIFLVVNKPEDVDELCVSVRLDTAHFQETENTAHDTETTVVDGPHVELPPPDEGHIDSGQAEEVLSYKKEFDSTWGGYHEYAVYEMEESDAVTWRPDEQGFDEYRIDTEAADGGYEILDSTAENGSIDVQVADDGEWIRLEASATSTADHGIDSSWNRRTPDEPTNEEHAKAQVTAKIHLISEEETATGEPTKELLLTTRGVCCCPGKEPTDTQQLVYDSVEIPQPKEYLDVELDPNYGFELNHPLLDPDRHLHAPDLRRGGIVDESERTAAQTDAAPTSIADLVSETKQAAVARKAGLMSVQEANAVSTDVTRGALLRGVSGHGRRSRPTTAAESEYPVTRLYETAREHQAVSGKFSEPALDDAPELVGALSEAIGVAPERVTREAVLERDTERIARETGFDETEINRRKLSMLNRTTTEDHPGGPTRKELTAALERLEEGLERVEDRLDCGDREEVETGEPETLESAIADLDAQLQELERLLERQEICDQPLRSAIDRKRKALTRTVEEVRERAPSEERE
ncbi:hypothetical protein EA472_01370 [Natrarchaeobius oligotrophus]|uniref:Uncharacterized protein n=2 Tax=Natrarchaeobius TaxID=2501796 RepID=A0A3N6PNG0_NATCH|nr:hypothetical protein EA472_01370 [Natrarchaeobius chitinivorans]